MIPMQNCLKELLTEYDVTLRTVSRDTGLDYSSLYNWWNNKRLIPYVPLLILADYLAVPPTRLVPSLQQRISQDQISELVKQLQEKPRQKPRRKLQALRSHEGVPA